MLETSIHEPSMYLSASTLAVLKIQVMDLLVCFEILSSIAIWLEINGNYVFKMLLSSSTSPYWFV